MLDRFALERRQQRQPLLDGLSYAAGLLGGVGLCVIVLVAAGVPPGSIVSELFGQVFLDPDGLAQTLTIAVPLVLVGLASAVAMRIRFWNIGIEGQFWLGAIGASNNAIQDDGPGGNRVAHMLVAYAVAGALWIAGPLWLRLRFRVSEMVVTLLLSNVAYLWLQHLLFGAWRDPANSFPVSPEFGPAEQLARLGFGDLHSGVWIALAATVLTGILVDRTRTGFYATAIGHNPLAARATGLPVTATTAVMVALSGALAGLAGGVVVAGSEHRLTQFIGINATFSAIVVAFVARFRPAGVLLAACVLAGVYNAGSTLKVFYSLSEAIVVLMQSLVLFSLLVAEFFATYRVHLSPAAGR